MKKKNSGFTLTELLAVIVILAVIISLASGSVIAIMNRAKKNMASEVRANLEEIAISYVLENKHLEKCDPAFSKEIYEDKNKNNLNSHTNCLAEVSVGELKNEGLFEDPRGVCKDSDIVIVYRYNDRENNSEYKAYSEDTCTN